jgi:predicted AAA+ superfamily ATPase
MDRIFSSLGWNNPLRYQRVGKSKCLLGYQDQRYIFQELKQREKKIYYFKDKSEGDFIVKTGLEVTEAIQVLATLSDATTRQRELRGLTEVLQQIRIAPWPDYVTFAAKRFFVMTMSDIFYKLVC